jgi:hypothetical protein
MTKFNRIIDIISSLEYFNEIVRKSEFKFIKPNSSENWEHKMIQCRLATDMLYGFYNLMDLEKDDYKIKLDWRFLYSSTTINISYDRSTYSFMLTYGHPVSEKQNHGKYDVYLSNREQIMGLAKAYQQYLHNLAFSMRDNLPKTHCDRIMAKIGLYYAQP